eukprot:742263-Rhodomonas_salina.1
MLSPCEQLTELRSSQHGGAVREHLHRLPSLSPDGKLTISLRKADNLPTDQLPATSDEKWTISLRKLDNLPAESQSQPGGECRRRPRAS